MRSYHENKKERIYLGQGLTLLSRLSQHCQAFPFNPGTNWSRPHNVFPSPENEKWEPGEQEGRASLSECRKRQCVHCLWLQYCCTFPRASSASAIGWDEGRERGWSMKRAAIRKDSFKHMCNARSDCCWVLSLIKSAWLSIDQNFSSPANLDQAVPPKSPGFILSSFVSQEWI